MKAKNNTAIGKSGEAEAVHFLLERSYKIIARNFHSNSGEIDIIARDPENKELVFCEVKTRARGLESALASMTQTKCRKIMRTAEYFLYKNPEFEDDFTRFDLLVVLVGEKGSKIHHIKEAISF